MADTIPLRYVQSLLRLAPMSDGELAQELETLNLPLVGVQLKTVAAARLPVEDYGRLFIHLVRKLQVSRGKDYSEVFGTPIQFGCARHGFSFPRHYLDFPMVQGEASLAAMLETYPAELFRIDPESKGVANKAKHLIGSDFQRTLPNLKEVADRLHMTISTLHHRLREEDTSFQQLKDQCRKHAAMAYLSTGTRTTQGLSELMGCSYSSTFHRAFKKIDRSNPLRIPRTALLKFSAPTFCKIKPWRVWHSGLE